MSRPITRAGCRAPRQVPRRRWVWTRLESISGDGRSVPVASDSRVEALAAVLVASDSAKTPRSSVVTLRTAALEARTAPQRPQSGQIRGQNPLDKLHRRCGSLGGPVQRCRTHCASSTGAVRGSAEIVLALVVVVRTLVVVTRAGHGHDRADLLRRDTLAGAAPPRPRATETTSRRMSAFTRLVWVRAPLGDHPV